MRIAVYAQRDFWEDFSQVLQAHEVEIVDPSEADLLSSLRVYDDRRFDRFVIMDEAAGDAEVISALDSFVNGPRAERSNMEPVFVSNAFRVQPSDFYRTLVMDLGVDQVIACGGEGEDYDYFGELVRTLRYPLRRSDVAHLCSKSEPPAPAKAPAKAVTAPALIDYRKTTRIVFTQPDRRSGSTHTAYACAASLRAMGSDVALVVSEEQAACLRRVYPHLAYDRDLGCMEVAGIFIYVGDTPAAAPDGFDYVLCDQGIALWLYDHDDAWRISAAKNQLDVFRHADLRIICSFVTPAGSWEFGRSQIKEIGARAMTNTTFTVFGVPTLEIEGALRDRVRSLNEHARLVTLPFIPAPLRISRAGDVPPAIVEVLRPTLPPKHLRLFDSSTEAAPEVEVPMERASRLKGIFKRKEKDV